MKLAIGCPVTNRGWILPTWLHYLDVATYALDAEVSLYFVCGTSQDNTEDILVDALKTRRGTILLEDEKPASGATRKWGYSRYEHMAEVRNLLLGLVREDRPNYFLSIDSDILLHGKALDNLLESIRKYDAVGGKVYLTRQPSTRAPSYAKLNSRTGNLLRPNHEGVMPVDVIMALKLMKPNAYNTDYEVHSHGEDIGWSIACRKRGLSLGWDGRTPSKHVMVPGDLNRHDPRVGY